MAQRLVVAMTGATGQIFGIEALKLLQKTDYESHLVLSNGARITLNQESDYTPSEVEALADSVYEFRNIGATIASGSFSTDGMLVAPCSMKTLSNIAHGNAQNLITRAADVTLKERRPLVVMPREKPLNRIHIKNMLEISDAGAVVMPPFLSYYKRSHSMGEMVSRTMVRSLASFEIDLPIDEWDGLSEDARVD